MKTFTPRERVKAAMNLQHPDRVPLMCQFSIGSMMNQLKPNPVEFWYDKNVFADGLVPPPPPASAPIPRAPSPSPTPQPPRSVPKPSTFLTPFTIPASYDQPLSTVGCQPAETATPTHSSSVSPPELPHP